MKVSGTRDAAEVAKLFSARDSMAALGQPCPDVVASAFGGVETMEGKTDEELTALYCQVDLASEVLEDSGQGYATLHLSRLPEGLASVRIHPD